MSVFANAGIDAGPGFLTTGGRPQPGGRDRRTSTTSIGIEVIEVNLTSVYTTVKHAARHMKPNGGGRIIVTSSIAAQINESDRRHALHAGQGRRSIISSARWRWNSAPTTSCVNCISPGPFMTNIAGGRLKIPADRKAFEAQSLIGRIGDAEDIKGLALYLASPCSSYVTGSQIVIDGGAMHRIK